MASEPKIYRRVTRASSNLAGYTSLWAASDHLLIAFSTGYNERYSRIDLQDVKAFVVMESSRRGIIAVIYGILAALMLVISLALFLTKSSFYFSGVFFVVGLVGLAVNGLLGPSCEVFIVTGVQVTKISGVTRRRKARKLLLKLEPLIREAQAKPGGDAVPDLVPPLPQ